MPETPKTPARPRRRLWVWGLLAVGALGLAGPALIPLTPLPQSLLAGALPAEAGRLTAASSSFSWTGPIRLGGLQLLDAKDAVLFSADSVELEGGLLGLLGGKTTPLRVRVDQPRVDLVVAPEGTNFDGVLEALKKKQAAEPPAIGPDGQPVAPSPQRPIEATVIGGAVLVTDATTGDSWLLDALQVQLSDPAQGFDAITLTAGGKLAAYADGQVAGTAGDFLVKVGRSEQGRHAEVKAAVVPLSMFRPFLRRADRSADIRGVIEIDGEADWRPSGQPIAGSSPGDLVRTLAAGGVRSAGMARLKGIEFVGQATQGGPVRLASIDLPWRVVGTGDTLTLQQVDLTSEVGRAAIVGAVSAGEVDRWAAGVAAVPREMNLTAQIDLDQLARVAPQFVHLQRGVRIDAGRIDASATFEAGRVEARLATGRLAGVAEGRRLEWREPLDVSFAAFQHTPTAGLAGWELQSLDASSSFFHAKARGDAARLTGDADFDLDRLARELAPLIDLGDVQLAGTGNATFLVNRRENAWRLTSRGGVQGLLVGTADAPLADEPKLDFDALLEGSLRALNATPTGSVTLSAGDDTLTATLPAPGAGTAQPFELKLAGDAVRWWRRAAALVPDLPSPEAIDLAGTLDVNALGVADAEGGKLDRFKLSLTGFGLNTAALDPATPRVRLRNERIEAEGVAAWRTRDRAVRVARGTFVSSVASASVKDVAVSLADPAASGGRIDYLVDLAQLASRTPPRGEPARYAARGKVGGMAQLRGLPDRLNLDIEIDGRQIELIDLAPAALANGSRPRQQIVWTEPRVQLDAELTVTPLTAEPAATVYALDIRDARVVSQSVNGSFGGRIADAAALRGVEISGGVDYDLEKLTPILWPTLGDGVRLVGRDRATFRFETDESVPLDAPAIARLRASVAAPWEGANLFGLPVGAGRLSANLAGGVLRVDPLDVAIGGGRLTAEAIAALDPPPATLSLRRGPLVTDVALSQQVNERILKFIAPVLADATRIDGRFSVALTELTVPLNPPRTGGPPPGRAAGVLDIHQVRVMPGPSVSQWVGVVRQLVGLARDGVQGATGSNDSVLIAIDNTPVDFQMIDGRVFHRGLKFYVGDALVESSGSVGIVDETLDLQLAVPILDEWIDREPVLLGRLRGQSLRIPISGTFKKPKVNNRAFQELSGRVLESAAAGAVESGLNKLFEKLRSR